MIPQYLIHSGLRLLFWNDKRSSDKSLRLWNAISFRPRNSQRFTKHIWPFSSAFKMRVKCEFITRAIAAFRFYLLGSTSEMNGFLPKDSEWSAVPSNDLILVPPSEQPADPSPEQPAVPSICRDTILSEHHSLVLP